MNVPGDQMSFPDETLIAYLDNELTLEERTAVERAAAIDAEMAARLTRLQGQPMDLREAFAPLLSEAPTARLKTMLDSLGVTNIGKEPVHHKHTVQRRQLIAASVAFLVVGGLAGQELTPLRHMLLPDGPGHWRDIVAAYVKLYTPETLSNIPDDPALRARELAEVGNIIGLKLSPKAVELPGVVLKRSQILKYDTTPLAEINYLDANASPMALCIVPSSQPATGLQVEVRRGLNIAFWNDGHHAFMVIGRQSLTSLEQVAQSITGQINTASL
jgi:anti-sigma factor RsiW